jgi:hypothetical protein
VRAAAPGQLHMGHIGPYDLGMGVEKQGIEFGQAQAAGKGDEEEQCTEPAGNPNHAGSLGS